MSAITIPHAPRAPRAMAQPTRIVSTKPSPEQIFHDASKKLYLRLALFESLANSKGASQPRVQSSDEVCEGRRDFLDSFAYLCDVAKGGAHVTAAGLEKLPYSNILWLAANEGISPDVQKYAENILQRLKKVDSETQKALQDDVFHLAVEKCNSRILFYRNEMQKYAIRCRKQLREETRDNTVISLLSRLEKLSEPPPSLTLGDHVDLCYAVRGAEVDEIRRRSKNEGDDFSRLVHYIGRLGATRSKVNTVVRAMITVPCLRQISTIRTVEAPPSREVKVDQDGISPYEIVWAICKESRSQNPIEIQSALHAIVDRDLPLNPEIRARLASRKAILTRVHAELQIADRFSRNSFMKFVDGDKYIGCSKPACYFCHNWLVYHKHDYVPPATHHKVILGCRGPDSDINEAGATVLREMYTKMCGVLGQDILTFFLKSQQGDASLGHHYMSTEGSSRSPSLIPTRHLPATS